MNLNVLLTILFAATCLLPEAFTCQASDASEATDKVDHGHDHDDDGYDDDDEYYDLADMTDEELEEICVSRGFELVREVDEKTGEPTVYTHQDYVDAASECLQIEEDLEEILESHPEILEDVKRESERMQNERDSLLEQLNNQQKQNETVAPVDSPEDEHRQSEDDEALIDLDQDSGDDETLTLAGSNNASIADKNVNNTDGQQPNSNNDLTFDLKEITLEVIQQMKSDFKKVFNFILPKETREKIQRLMKQQISTADKNVNNTDVQQLSNKNELNDDAKETALEGIELMKADFKKVVRLMKQQILPALKSFGLVAKDMGMTAFDMAKRYLMAFMNKGEQNDNITDASSDDDDNKVPSEQIESTEGKE